MQETGKGIDQMGCEFTAIRQGLWNLGTDERKLKTDIKMHSTLSNFVL